MTTVAVIGNHQHPFCSEVYFARGFAENGCAAIPVQIEGAVRDPDDTMSLLQSVDVVTYTRTHSAGRWLDQTWTGRWRALEADGIRTVGMHLDRFWGLEREHLIGDGDAQFTVGTLFTADGGNDDRWIEAGIEHRWMAPAVDRLEAMEPGTWRADLADDIVFAGSSGRRYHGSYPERGELLDHLRRTYGRRFVHYGHDGDRPVVRQQDLNDLYASAAIVVGDSCFANSPDAPADRYWSDRVPETVGRGGFLLHPWVRGLRGFGKADAFGPDELATYNPGDWEDLDAQIGGYLANPGEREGFVERGRARVLRDHTYTARCRTILEAVGLREETP